jgi:hypothetical protein
MGQVQRPALDEHGPPTPADIAVSCDTLGVHEGGRMAHERPTQRDLAAARKVERQQEMDDAIADGRLVVRTMTPEERQQSDARRAAAAAKGRDTRRRRHPR